MRLYFDKMIFFIMTIYVHIFSTNTITNLTVTEFYFNQINPKTIQIKKTTDFIQQYKYDLIKFMKEKTMQQQQQQKRGKISFSISI